MQKHAAFKSHNTPLLLQVYIETISSCNRKCPYCYYAEGMDSGKNNRIMTMEVFNKIISDLEQMNYCNLIYLYDINEPLMDSRLPVFVEMISKRLPNARTYIFSNGDLATIDNITELFDKGLSHFVFSRHDTKNDSKIKSIISRIGESRCSIADMTILDASEFVNRGGSITDRRIASQKRYKSPCYLPFHQLCIDPDGNYRLCCAIRDEVVLGNISSESISDYFYHNSRLQHYREKLLYESRASLYPCNKCSYSGDNTEGISNKLGMNYRLRNAIFSVSSSGLI